MAREVLLITCFEPFGGRSENRSLQAAELLPAVIGGYRLEKLRLPTVYGEAAERAIRTAEELGAAAILSLGEAGGRQAITPEKVGLNLRWARIPDNAGNEPKDVPVVPGGENALFSTLPARDMAWAIQAAGLPGEVSYSAGTYVCNDLFYSLLHRFRDTPVRCGFIHVPAEGDLTAEDLARGIRAAIESL